MKSIAFIAIGICIVFISACDKKNLPDKGATYAEQVSNEWWVTATPQGGKTSDVFKIATYNTSMNLDSIFIDDANYWSFKCKAKVDLANKTFSTGSIESMYDLKVPGSSPAQYYRPTVTISNGKILPKAAKSLSGNTTDSIYMELEFSDDPGTKYIYAGHARTRFSEDEY
jgi:hypothetical protein